jgi:carboxypeptidase PM20D1
MKKTVRFLLWLTILFLIIVLIKTMTFRSLQIKTEPVVINLFGDESAAHLSRAVAFPTISYSEYSPVDTAAFKGFLTYIDDTYPLIKSKLNKEIFNEFSLLYTWKGGNDSLKPVILMAHMDVVPAGDTSSWENAPFSGRNDGTYIWGRGTLDDKSGMISILEAVEKLLNEGFQPGRTIYMAFGHDEELSGNRGARTIANALKERGIEAEFVLDEGTTITQGIFPLIKKPVALIGTSEKGYLSVNLIVDMQGGHSSMPEKESAIIVLNKAIYDLVNKPMKAKITGPMNDFMRYIGPELPFYAKAVFANKWIFRGILLNNYQGSSSGNALVRTTTAPTIISGGIKDNIVPAKAEATINFRILPGETSTDVIDHIEKTVNDKRVIISPIEEGRCEPAPVSPSNSAGFINICTVIRQIYPESAVTTTMILGSSDCRHFSEVSRNIYRFVPVILNSDDLVRLHGLDERIRIDDFKRGIAFYYQLIKISN